MTREEYLNRVKMYRKTNRTYAGVLTYIFMFCQEDFLPIFEKAENEGKKLYILEDNTLNEDAEMEPYVELNNIGMK